MLRYLTYSLLVFAFTVGCASKKTGDGSDSLAGGDASLNESDITERPLAFDPLGSDSGTIAGLTTVNFDYDSSTLRSDAKAQLAKNAEWIKANTGVMIQIEGHCDSKGSNEYNLTLGERRANAVKAYLQGLGVEGGRLSTISYGEEKLISMGDSESDHFKNRRANFVPAK